MTTLTIPNETTEIEYAVGATLSTGPFTIPFSFFANADVRVAINDGTTTTILVLTNDYTVAGVAVDGGFDGGTVTLLVGVQNSTVKVYRDVVIDRTTNFGTTGPFDILSLNDELNKIIAIEQELAALKGNFMHLPESAIATDPFDAATRGIDNLGELAALDSAATRRQVSASGPNGLADDDLETGPLTINQWNTVISITNVVIQGKTTATTKLFDLVTQYFTLIQNRAANEAEFHLRYRYIVDCYSEISKQQSSVYRIKVPLTSSVPLPFMDVVQDVDYFNGNGTLSVFIDIFPNGSAAANLFTQCNNLTVTTSEPA